MSEKKSKTGKDNSLSKTYVSKELYLDITKLENDFKRADIEIHNVDHSGLSYEGRVFLNNPKARSKNQINIRQGICRRISYLWPWRMLWRFRSL